MEEIHQIKFFWVMFLYVIGRFRLFIFEADWGQQFSIKEIQHLSRFTYVSVTFILISTLCIIHDHDSYMYVYVYIAGYWSGIEKRGTWVCGALPTRHMRCEFLLILILSFCFWQDPTRTFLKKRVVENYHLTCTYNLQYYFFRLHQYIWKVSCNVCYFAKVLLAWENEN